jgi:hypothetical protein
MFVEHNRSALFYYEVAPRRGGPPYCSTPVSHGTKLNPSSIKYIVPLCAKIHVKYKGTTGTHKRTLL